MVNRHGGSPVAISLGRVQSHEHAEVRRRTIAGVPGSGEFRSIRRRAGNLRRAGGTLHAVCAQVRVLTVRNCRWKRYYQIARGGHVFAFPGSSQSAVRDSMEGRMSAYTATQSDQQNGTTKWTIMVFMGAATITGNEPLIKAAEDDLAEMRFVGSGDVLEETSKTNQKPKVIGKVNILVQVHQGANVAPRRGRICEHTEPRIDALTEVPKDEQDPTRGWALLHFIAWAIDTANHEKGDRLVLVLWGHAYDFALGREQTAKGIIDALDFAELSGVLETLQQRYGKGMKLDILGCDACDLATVEMACQIQPFADYLLCSQIGIPIPGWPYDRILY